MKRVLTALVLIPLVLLAVFKAPSWLFTLLVGAVALLALKEYLDLVEAYGVKPIRWLTYVVSLLYILRFMLYDDTAHHWIGLALNAVGIDGSRLLVALIALDWLIPFLFLIAAMRSPELRTAFARAASSMFGVMYVVCSLLLLARLQSHGWFVVVFTFIAVWAGDTVAMYVGKAIGRHKMSPRISPGKTWEGAVGSVIGSVAFCWLIWKFAERINDALVLHFTERGHDLPSVLHPLPELTIWSVLVIAIVLNIAAQLGDLVESLIKRGANVKDSGTMLPGHG